MNNTIFTDMDETIGYYKDINKEYKDLITSTAKDGDYDNTVDLIQQLEDIDYYREYSGLLKLSMNNGMGFTCEKLVDIDKLIIGIVSTLERKEIKINSQVLEELKGYIQQHLEDRGVI